MTQNYKVIKKFVSVMLILAICITTVFGCVLSVSADTTADATYTVNVEKTIIPYGDEGTAYLTFDLASGFRGGSFTLLENFVEPREDEIEAAIEYLIEEGTIPSDADVTIENYKDSEYIDQINLKLAFWTYEFQKVNVTVSDGVAVEGEFSAADFTVSNTMHSDDGTYSPNNSERHKYDRLSDVLFTAAKAYTSVTFQLDYEYEYHVRVGADNPTSENGIRLAHAEYSTNELDQCSDGGYKEITYTDPTLIDTTGATHTATKYQPEGTYDFFHAHRWDWRGQTPVHTNANGYWIYEAQCTLCDMTHHQLGSKYTSQGQSHNYYEISGINVQYEDDGTVSVNVHVPTATENEELVICKMDGTPTKYGSIEVTAENYDEVLTDSYYAKAQAVDEDGNIVGYGDNILPHGTKMYTIKGLSATDLKSELMLTRLVDKMYIGASHPFSLEEYALKVIAGEDVYYPTATTEAQKTADKEVAAAFVNYAVNASNALDNKISSKPKSIVEWSGEYKIQDEAAFLASLRDESGNVGTGTEDDPYIITTPEQLFYIACFAGENSKDKYYKVSDFVGEFDMGAYDYETPIDTIKENLASGRHNNHANSTPFQGNFDGNGVIIYGLDGRSYQTGLFPKTIGDVTIKNLTVMSSSFVATSATAAGAIVGEAGNITIENCAVKWCYFEGTDGNTSMGTVIGKTSNYCKAEISNCMVLDNYFYVPDAEAQMLPYGGLIGFSWAAPSGGHSYRSIIAIGNAPYSTVYDEGQYNSSRPTSDNVSSRYSNTFHGVYTDQPESYFCGYYSNGTASNVTWSPDHDIQQLTFEQMTGEDIKVNMPYLDWSQWFTVADGAPRLRNFYQSGKLQEKVLVWDGTVATEFESGSGTADDPYIIADPSQLAYMVSGAGSTGNDETTNKTYNTYYKVADGIMGFDMNGYKNITLDSTVENLASATRTHATNYDWGNVVDFGGTVIWFAGNFDGNHVQIFNLYGKDYAMGLFPAASNTATIKNVSVENSWLQATAAHGSYGAGGLIGAMQKRFTSLSANAYIENCTVRDCYISNTATGSTSTVIPAAHAVGQATWVTPQITNCFFANNTLDVSTAKTGSGYSEGEGYTSTAVGGIVGNSNGTTALTGVVHVSHVTDENELISTGLIGDYINYAFSDCYTTDSTVDTTVYSGVMVLEGGYSDILGGNAVVNMPALHWGSIWFAGQPGEYPALYDDDIANLPVEITTLLNAPVVDESGNILVDGWDNFVTNYDAKTNHNFTTTDTDLNMYSSGLNLKDNPYLLVTFEIMGKYREDKENVVATFSVGDQVITVKGSEMINNEGAGRFHLVRLKGVNITNLWDSIDVSVSYNGEEILTGTLSVAGFVYKANRSGPEYQHYAKAGLSLIYYSQVLNARKIVKEQTPPLVTNDTELANAISSGKNYNIIGGTYASQIDVNGVNVTITDAVINNGTTAVIKVQNGGTVTINSADITANPNISGTVSVKTNGTLIINGGTYGRWIFAMGDSTGTIIINGGTFDCDYINGYMGYMSKVGTVVITGGTFKTEPSASYIAEGYEVVQNEDGTYTVQAS